MGSRFILEEVAVVENDFSVDSRDKDGIRVVLFEHRRTIKLHFAIEHILHIEIVRDTKAGEPRSIVSLTNGQRYVTKRSAQEICTAIEKAAA